jgi:hypothetical protein
MFYVKFLLFFIKLDAVTRHLKHFFTFYEAVNHRNIL